MRCLSVAACVLGLVSVAIAPQSAWAGEWSPPVSDAAIALPFGVEYPGGVHCGIDIPAEPAAEVVAPAAGRVTFSGTIPADGGGTCTAVTIETGDGLRISLLPLEAAYVQSGEELRPGDVVGRLAATGDDSSDVPHLHMGVRRGDQYIDPAPLLPAPAIQEPDAPAVAGEASDGAGDAGSVADGTCAPAAAVSGPARAQSPEPLQPTSSVDTVPTRTTSSGTADTGVEAVCAEAGVQVDRASTCPAPGGTTGAPAVSHTAAPDARLVRDAGIAGAASRDVGTTGVGVATGSTRWVSGRRSESLLPVVQQPVVRALVALAAAIGGIMPIIARSKALVRAR